MQRSLIACLLIWPAAAQVNVLTYRNDNARTARNLSEPLLSPNNVNSSKFGRRYSHQVDGLIYAQPLYMSAVPVAGSGLHDILVVATGHDTLYAFDADDNQGSNATPLWQVSYVNAGQGITSVPWQDVNCPVIFPELGIIGTPVIDPATYTIYFVTFTKETSGGSVRYVHRLHAVDVRSGQENPASPVEIQGSVPGTGDGTGTVTFVPLSYKQRSALLLANGVVYVAWSSHCDHGQYHGWIMGYSASTLRQVAVYNATPNGSGGSFWAGGAGPAADENGNLFVVSANGTFDNSFATPDLGDSIIRLAPQNGLTTTDYFTPSNQLDLANNDLDLGSAGALLLPREAASSTHPNLVIAAGKEGRIYLVDRDAMGRYNPLSDAQTLSTLLLPGTGVFGGPAYFSGHIYFSASNDQLRSLQIENAVLSPTPSSVSSMSFPFPASSPIISANGSSNGIVWAYEPGTGPGTLHAFDASDLSKELFHGDTDNYLEFAMPTAVDGKVYVGTQNILQVFGLLPPKAGSITTVVNAASFNASIAPGSLISVFGSGLAQTTAGALQIPLPISLADTSVTINGVRAPLLYVSAGQINAQVPEQIPAGNATLTVTTSGSQTGPASLKVAAAAPQIFIAGANRILAFNQDWSVNSQSNPAPVGSVVIVFLTGQGALASPSATIGGLSAQLKYAGPAPGTVGVAQFNMVVPALKSGDYPLAVTIGGVQSNTGLISVH